MNIPVTLNVVGLTLTLIGGALLFFYGAPSKKYQNIFIYSETVAKSEPLAGERDVAQSEWQRVAASFQKRARFFNRLGFALVTLGTLLQFGQFF